MRLPHAILAKSLLHEIKLGLPFKMPNEPAHWHGPRFPTIHASNTKTQPCKINSRKEIIKIMISLN